jgi:uncharacterized membrane protein YkvA (DUF1232 family)
MGDTHLVAMAFARTAFWRNDNEDAFQRRFWRKLKRVAALIPFTEDLLAAYYCAFDKETPFSAKATLIAAIGYFILPIDAIPDVLPVIGFTDDAAVLAAAIKIVANNIRPVHREAARNALGRLPV